MRFFSLYWPDFLALITLKWSPRSLHCMLKMKTAFRVIKMTREEQQKDMIVMILIFRVCARDVIKFLKSETKEPLMVLSSSGIRGTKFISVYNFPAQ